MMMDVIPGVPEPKDEWTEQELAQAILMVAEMEYQGQPLFEMSSWVKVDSMPNTYIDTIDVLDLPRDWNYEDIGGFPSQLVLEIGEAPPCGTTMCIAGWAAYFTKWKMHHLAINATRDGEWKGVDNIGHDALGLNTYALFYTGNEVGLQFLRWLAAGVKLRGGNDVYKMERLFNRDVDITEITDPEKLDAAYATIPPVEN